MGLNLARVPRRCTGEVKEGLLKLIDAAVEGGWSHARACRTLGVSDVRAHRWRARRRKVGTLEDLAPGGNPVHRILAWERQAVLALVEEWGPTDRTHRKLAYRGSYLGRVFVSPSTLLRITNDAGVSLPGEPPRPSRPAPVLPEIPWEPNRIWIWDAERHEALLDCAVVKGHRLWLVAAGRKKLGAARSRGREGGRQAAPTKPGRASTVRWSGSGKRDRKVYVRNQRLNAPQEIHQLEPDGSGLGSSAHLHGDAVGGTPWSVSVADREVTAKVCGVAVAMLQGHSWVPTLSNSSRVNVGTTLPVPPGRPARTEGGKARRRLMPVGWGGGPVVVRGRESRPPGEGVQRVRSRNADRGGRW